jgi:hypothetical protein
MRFHCLFMALSLLLFIQSLVVLGMQLFQDSFLDPAASTWLLQPTDSANAALLEKRDKACSFLKSSNALLGVSEYYTRSHQFGLFLPLNCLDAALPSWESFNKDDMLNLFKSNPFLAILLASYPQDAPVAKSPFVLSQERLKALIKLFLNENTDIIQKTPAETWIVFWNIISGRIIQLPIQSVLRPDFFHGEFLPLNGDEPNEAVNVAQLFTSVLDVEHFLQLPKAFRDKILKPYFAAHLNESYDIATKLQQVMQVEEKANGMLQSGAQPFNPQNPLDDQKAPKAEEQAKAPEPPKELKAPEPAKDPNTKPNQSNEPVSEKKSDNMLDKVAAIFKKDNKPITDKLDNLFRLQPKEKGSDQNKEDLKKDSKKEDMKVENKPPESEISKAESKTDAKKEENARNDIKEEKKPGAQPILVTSTVIAPVQMATSTVQFLGGLIQREDILRFLMPPVLTKTAIPEPPQFMYPMMALNGGAAPYPPPPYLPYAGYPYMPAPVTVTLSPNPDQPLHGYRAPIQYMNGMASGNQKAAGFNLDFLKLDNIKKALNLKKDQMPTKPRDPWRVDFTQVKGVTEVSQEVPAMTVTLVSAFPQQVIHVTPAQDVKDERGNHKIIPISTEERIKTVTLIHEQAPQNDKRKEAFELKGKGLYGGEPFEWAEGKARQEESRVRELTLKRISDNQFLLVENTSVCTPVSFLLACFIVAFF